MLHIYIYDISNLRVNHESIWGTTGINSCIFVDLDTISRSRPCRFIARERDPICIKSKIWGGEGEGEPFWTLRRGKFFCLMPGMETGLLDLLYMVYSPQRLKYTNTRGEEYEH